MIYASAWPASLRFSATDGNLCWCLSDLRALSERIRIIDSRVYDILMSPSSTPAPAIMPSSAAMLFAPLNPICGHSSEIEHAKRLAGRFGFLTGKLHQLRAVHDEPRMADGGESCVAYAPDC